jgi:hypothetical protein
MTVLWTRSYLVSDRIEYHGQNPDARLLRRIYFATAKGGTLFGILKYACDSDPAVHAVINDIWNGDRTTPKLVHSVDKPFALEADHANFLRFLGFNLRTGRLGPTPIRVSAKNATIPVSHTTIPAGYVTSNFIILEFPCWAVVFILATPGLLKISLLSWKKLFPRGRPSLWPLVAAFCITHCVACYLSFILTACFVLATIPPNVFHPAEIHWLTTFLYWLLAPIVMPWAFFNILPDMDHNPNLQAPLKFSIAVYLIVFIASFVLLRRRRLKANRIAAGFCPVCDYDLRATPDRCPECGKTVETIA